MVANSKAFVELTNSLLESLAMPEARTRSDLSIPDTEAPSEPSETSLWKFFLDEQTGGKALEIGAGPQSEIHHLFEWYSQFLLIDNDSGRLAYSKSFHESLAGPTDISYLDVRDGWQGFRGDFDCILLTALANVPVRSSFSGQSAQYADFLSACHSLLRPNGQLVLFASNRFSIHNSSFAQAFFTTELTTRGHLRALNKAGFESVSHYGLQFANGAIADYVPLPPLSSTGKLLAVPRTAPLKSMLKQRYMTPGVVFIANKSEATRPTLLEALVKRATGDTTTASATSIGQTTERHLTRKGKLILRTTRSGNDSILKITLRPQAVTAEANNQDTLHWLSQYAGDAGIFPAVINHGTFRGQHYFAETSAQGKPLKEIISLTDRDGVLGIVIELITSMRDISARGGLYCTGLLEDSLYQTLVAQKISRIAGLLADKELEIKLSDYFSTHLKGANLSYGLLHGDLSVSNILVKDNRINGLIDWETSSLRDISILDAINFIDSVLRLFNPDKLINSTIPALAEKILLTDAEKAFLHESFALFEIDPTLHRPLVYLRWLRHVNYLMDYWLANDHKAQKRYIYDIAATL